MMMKDPGAYSERAFLSAVVDQVSALIKPSFLTPVKKPRAFLLGGQSGAGKTTLHKILSKHFLHNVIVINGDEYRSLHPLYRELDAEYGPECVKYTASWAGKMTEALVDAFSLMGYNLVIEGTLRTSEVPISTAKLLRSRGYSVSLACMAVKPEISLVSCQIRYERMRLAGTVPRATDPAHHNAIISDIVSNISTLEQSGLFDEVRLYDRRGSCLYSGRASREGGKSNPETASDALKKVLFGPWTAEEKLHRQFLEEELRTLKGRTLDGKSQ